MKKIILSLVLVTNLNAVMNAQDGMNSKTEKQESRKDMPPEERAKKTANWAEKKLGLTQQQKTSWETAALKRIQANKPYHEKLKGSTTPEERKDLHEKIKVNAKSFDDAVSTFLTAEQKAKWDQIKKEKHEAHKEKNKNGKMKEAVVEDDLEN